MTNTTKTALAPLALALLLASGMSLADDASERIGIPAAGETPARLERLVAAPYPPHVRDQGISGVVIVLARVGRDGRVRETRIDHSVPELDETARAVAGRYEFAPARRGDDEVESWVRIPVRFDATLPVGAQASESFAAAQYPEVERSFESEVATLQQSEPSAPSADDFELRRRIMRASLLLDVLPPPGIEALHALDRGDSLARAASPELRETRRDSWRLAAHLAPWWPLPYRRLAAVANADREHEMTARCAEIILAGRPGDEWALAMKRRGRQIQLAEGSERGGSNGGKRKK